MEEVDFIARERLKKVEATTKDEFITSKVTFLLRWGQGNGITDK